MYIAASVSFQLCVASWRICVIFFDAITTLGADLFNSSICEHFKN